MGKDSIDNNVKKLNNQNLDFDNKQRNFAIQKNKNNKNKIKNCESEKEEKPFKESANNDNHIKHNLDIPSSRSRSSQQNLKLDSFSNAKPLLLNIPQTKKDIIPEKKTVENVPTENLVLKKNNSRLIIKNVDSMNM